MRNIYFVNQQTMAIQQKSDEKHFPLPRKALSDRRLTGSSLKLLAGLYFYCACPKRMVIRSAKEISKLVGLSEFTTIDSLMVLARIGYLFSLEDDVGLGFSFPMKNFDVVSIGRAGWPTLFCPGIRGTSCLIFLTISFHADDQGASQLSYSQLHEETGVSCTNVPLVVKQLEGLGVLRIEHAKINNSIQAINRYYILEPAN